MRISTNRRYQNAKINTGFEVVDFDTLAELKSIVTFDHAPAIFDNGIRHGDNVITCDTIIMDVDNTEYDVSMDEFSSIFSGSMYWITTSKSHQKEKISGKEVSPPRDRYHVIFSLMRPVTKSEYKIVATNLIEKYPFFDSSCSDASRFLFGNQDVEVFFHDGLSLDVPAVEQKTENMDKWEYDYNDYTSKDRKQIILSSLQIASANDEFRNYKDWINLGMALKADGWTLDDWITLSYSDTNMHEARTHWESFPDSGKISGGTLLFYARKGNPNCLVAGKQNETVSRVQNVTIPAVIKDIATKKFDLISTNVTRLDTIPNANIVKAVRKEIMTESTDENGKKIMVLKDDWYFCVCNMDPELANSIHFDYTTGDLTFAYYNTRMLNNAILQRLRCYVGVKRITAQVVERVIDYIMAANGSHNRVVELMDRIKMKWPRQEDKAFGWEIDEFLSIFQYQAPIDSPYSNTELRQYYAEIWHLFFLRMHMHIEGTRMIDGRCKHLIENDIVPILQGEQGIGKGTLTRWISMAHINTELYVDVGSGMKSGFGGQETAKACRGRLVAELGEMKLMKKADDVETVKSFISKTQYDIDVKFVEYTRPLPVTVSFIGTSNEKENLSDSTGNRRWWPIWLQSIDKDYIAKSRDLIEQLHAHYARLVEHTDESRWFDLLKPSLNLSKFMADIRERSMVRYSDYDAIIEVVSTDYVDGKGKRKVHTVSKHTVEKMVFNAGYNMRIGDRSFNDAMETMKYEKAVVNINGHRIRGWKKSYIDNEELDY